MNARIQMPRKGWHASLVLSDRDGLRSHLPSPKEFDSSVEERFAVKWGDEPREGWTLYREAEMLHKKQKVFIPDYVFRHENGKKAYFEIVGFWTPEYLEAKARTLELFRDAPIILAVHESLKERMPPQPLPTIFYKTNLKIKDILGHSIRI